MSMLCLLVLQTALATWFLSGIFYTFTHLALASQRSKRRAGWRAEEQVVRFNAIMYIKGDHG